jgi:hypothetical protein
MAMRSVRPAAAIEGFTIGECLDRGLHGDAVERDGPDTFKSDILSENLHSCRPLRLFRMNLT